MRGCSWWARDRKPMHSRLRSAPFLPERGVEWCSAVRVGTWPRSMAALDLAVFPSLREAQGLAVLEAMAAGRPVIASAVGGIPETIRNGIDGVLVPPDQPVALEMAIARLAHHHRLRRRLAAAGHRRVVQEFSAAASVRKVESVYLEELTRAGVVAPRPTTPPAKRRAAVPGDRLVRGADRFDRHSGGRSRASEAVLDDRAGLRSARGRRRHLRPAPAAGWRRSQRLPRPMARPAPDPAAHSPGPVHR